MSQTFKKSKYQKSIDPISITDITSLRSYITIANSGEIVNVSLEDCLIAVSRESLVDKEIKSNLSINCLIGEPIVLYIPTMNLDLHGTITSTKHVGKGCYEIYLTFADSFPEYWRECLLELLPYSKNLTAGGSEDEEDFWPERNPSFDDLDTSFGFPSSPKATNKSSPLQKSKKPHLKKV